MNLTIALALLVLGAALLLKGADWFVDSAGDLAKALGVSALLVGIVLAGLEPEEMLTAAIASARGAPELAIGNVIGTNVTIITAGLGISALIMPIRIAHARRQALLATLVSVPPIALLLTGQVTRLAGIMLLVIFAGYTLLLVRLDRGALAQREELEELLEGGTGDAASPPKPRLSKAAYVRRKALWTLVGLAAMAAGGPAIVEGALRTAAVAGLREGVVGLTIVSLGTSAEMIALGVSAARKGRADLLVGGILGSFAYNLLVTLGLAAVVHPLPVNQAATLIPITIMIAAHLGLLALVFWERIPRVVGALLIALYVAYLALAIFSPHI